MGIEINDPREHTKDCGDDTTIVLGMVVAFVLALFLSGCAAHVGPSVDRGWISWDICGFEGGVAAEIQVLALSARLGCTNPEETTVVDPQATP